MAKSNQLLGVANNLADSFVSATNICFLKQLGSSPIEQSGSIEIDLLKKTISPQASISKTAIETVAQYNRWFISELEKLKIGLNEIDKVVIQVAYKPGKSFGRYYTCNVTISANGKEYAKNANSSFL